MVNFLSPNPTGMVTQHGKLAFASPFGPHLVVFLHKGATPFEEKGSGGGPYAQLY